MTRKTKKRDRLEAAYELFCSREDMSLDELYEACLAAGYYSAELLESLGKRAAIAELRDYLNARDPVTGKRRGYHFRQMSVDEEGEPCERDAYVQQKFLSLDRFAAWFTERLEARNALDEDLRSEVRDAVDRWTEAKVRKIPGIGEFMPEPKS